MSTAPVSPPAAYDDLRALPPEVRAEILDGEVVVSPSSTPRHNRRAYLLARDLDRAAAPAGYAAVLDVDVLWPGTGDVTRPDLAVVTAATADSAELPVRERPVLVVEVLSPSSATRDLVRKARTAAVAEVPEYWVVDPETCEVVRHTVVGGRYEPEVLAPGDERPVGTLPFPYVLRPAVLGAPVTR